MVEREEELIDCVFAAECEEGVAFGKHISNAAGRQGFLVSADNVESAINLSRHLEETLGFDPCKTELIRFPGSGNANSTFGFSLNRWGGSTWEPEGPKPNWKVGPPKDPHAN